MDLASAEAEIRRVFGDTPITEASIGAAPPDILVKLSARSMSTQSGSFGVPRNSSVSDAARRFSEYYFFKIFL